MRRPTTRFVFLAAIVALVVSSIALTLYAFVPAAATRQTREVSFGALFLPAAAAVLVVQAMSYPSLGHRLTASVVLFVGGLVFTVVMLFALGCGFYGACSK